MSQHNAGQPDDPAHEFAYRAGSGQEEGHDRSALQERLKQDDDPRFEQHGKNKIENESQYGLNWRKFASKHFDFRNFSPEQNHNHRYMMQALATTLVFAAATTSGAGTILAAGGAMGYFLTGTASSLRNIGQYLNRKGVFEPIKELFSSDTEQAHNQANEHEVERGNHLLSFFTNVPMAALSVSPTGMVTCAQYLMEFLSEADKALNDTANNKNATAQEASNNAVELPNEPEKFERESTQDNENPQGFVERPIGALKQHFYQSAGYTGRGLRKALGQDEAGNDRLDSWSGTTQKSRSAVQSLEGVAIFAGVTAASMSGVGAAAIVLSGVPLALASMAAQQAKQQQNDAENRADQTLNNTKHQQNRRKDMAASVSPWRSAPT